MSKVVNVPELCPNEVRWAKNYNLEKIRLILYDSLGNQVFNDLVGLNDVIDVDEVKIDKPIIQEIQIRKPLGNVSKKYKLNLDLSYKTTPPIISDKVASVGEAFGVGVDESKEFIIFDNINLDFDLNDLIYCTGDSGSGKSSFIKLLKNYFDENGFKYADFDDIKPDPEEVVIDNISPNIDDSMYILSTVGLSEAFLMVRRYKELSQGQKYRYKLGKLFSNNVDAYLIDEFGATLDRIMAKVLAYCVQKWARRTEKMLIIASTHEDLIEDLNPNILIYKGFGEKTNIYYYDTERKSISFINELRVEKADKEDWNLLKEFHYVESERLGFVKDRWKLTHYSKPIGIIIYNTPFLQVKLRNKALPEYKGLDKAKKVNDEIIRIGRVVIHPKYRGCGLAQLLIQKTLHLTNMRIVETIAAMPKYNPFFEKVGFRNMGIIAFSGWQKKLITVIKSLGGDPSLLHSKIIRKQFLNNLDSRSLNIIIRVIQNAIDKMGGGQRAKNVSDRIKNYLINGDIDSCLSELMPVERVYLYWKNPNWNG